MLKNSRGLVAAMLMTASAAGGAQTYRPEGGSGAIRLGPDDYGSLLRQATEGQEPRPLEVIPVPPSPRRAAPPAAPRESRLRPEMFSKDALERPAGPVYLHDSSEYAGEPHRVKVVDRSRFDDAFLPTDLPNTMRLEPGSILVDSRARQLYFAIDADRVRRYGIAVGKDGATWRGTSTVGRMAKWPTWYPTANIRRENRRLKARVPGGPSNPLGARAIYLHDGERDTLYRIHGTTVPSSIGKFASHGCIRMINEDVIELYGMVGVGARVVVR